MAVQTVVRTDLTIGRLILAIAFVLELAVAFGWVTSTSVHIDWLGVALIALGLAL
jgi:hypothetical protein